MMRRHTLRALVTVALCFPAASAAQEAAEPPPVGPVTRGIRSSDWTRVEDLKNLPTESGKLFARETWSSLALVLVGQAGAPVLWLSSFLAIMLLWKRPALIAAITRAATGVGRPKTDRFMNTLAAVAWTLALASHYLCSSPRPVGSYKSLLVVATSRTL